MAYMIPFAPGFQPMGGYPPTFGGLPSYSNFPAPSYFNYTAPTFDTAMLSGPLSVPSSYADKDARAQWNSFSNNFLQPYLDYNLQARTQGFSEAQQVAAMQEQQWLNRQQNLLALRASGREDEAMALQKEWNSRDYEEAVRRFNAEQSFAQTQLQQQRFLEMQGLGLQRQLGMGNLGVARQGAQTARYGAETERMLGRGQLAENQRQFNRQYGLDTQRFGLERQLGMGNLNLDRQRFGLESELGRGGLDLERQRFGLQQQEFGESQRQFNERQAQEAALSREQMRSSELQNRYSTFGRSQAPSFRQTVSWR